MTYGISWMGGGKWAYGLQYAPRHFYTPWSMDFLLTGNTDTEHPLIGSCCCCLCCFCLCWVLLLFCCCYLLGPAVVLLLLFLLLLLLLLFMLGPDVVFVAVVFVVVFVGYRVRIDSPEDSLCLWGGGIFRGSSVWQVLFSRQCQRISLV